MEKKSVFLTFCGLPETGLKAIADYLLLQDLAVIYAEDLSVHTRQTIPPPYAPAKKTPALPSSPEKDTVYLSAHIPAEGRAILLYCDPWDYVVYAKKHHRLNEQEAISQWTAYTTSLLDSFDRDRHLLISSYAFMQDPQRLLQYLSERFGFDVDTTQAYLKYEFFYNRKHYHDGISLDLIQRCRQNTTCIALLKRLHTEAEWAHDIIDPVSGSRVDVIIPCYNLGHLAGETLASLQRSLAQNFDIIIIDDGSTDPESNRRLDEIEAMGFRVVRQKNTGLSVALNNAIRLCSNEYLLVLSADDKVDPVFITKAIRKLDEDPETGVVYCNPKTFGSAYDLWIVPDFDVTRFLGMNFIVASSVFRRSLWEKAGGFDTRVKGYEDWEMWISCLEQGAKFEHINEYLFHYRYSPTSKVQTSNLPRNRQDLVTYISGKHSGVYPPHIPGILGFLHHTLGTLQMRMRPTEQQIDYQKIDRGRKALGFLGNMLYRMLRKAGHIALKKDEERDK